MIAIHNTLGSFSDKWIEYCKEKGYLYKLVNCFDSDLLSQLDKADMLLWHFSQDDPAELKFARSIIESLEVKGVKVFPNIKTCWHFDDKISQKYLLEAINASIVPTRVFYNKKIALDFVNKSTYPIVFKLRCGAGASNVKLIKSINEANKIVNKAFSDGFTPVASYFADATTKIRKTLTINNLISKFKRIVPSILEIQYRKHNQQKEIGYVLFQEYLTENKYDTRITVIGNKAFGFIRYNRPDDFRASGSGIIEYDPNKVDKKCIEIAFFVAKKIGSQSLAFDFLYDKNLKPLICEISYCFKSEAVFNCPGYWDEQLNWNEGHFWPELIILENILVEK